MSIWWTKYISSSSCSFGEPSKATRRSLCFCLISSLDSDYKEAKKNILASETLHTLKSSFVLSLRIDVVNHNSAAFDASNMCLEHEVMVVERVRVVASQVEVVVTVENPLVSSSVPIAILMYIY